MNQQDAHDINVGMDLYHQLIEAKMEAERWKAKYEDLEQRLAGDEVTRLMAEVVEWREKYDRLDKAHDLLECHSRQHQAKDNLIYSTTCLYDTVIDLIQHPMIEAQWEELLTVIKLIDADNYTKLKAHIERLIMNRIMNASE